jgi:hypothetical protein
MESHVLRPIMTALRFPSTVGEEVTPLKWAISPGKRHTFQKFENTMVNSKKQ